MIIIIIIIVDSRSKQPNSQRFPTDRIVETIRILCMNADADASRSEVKFIVVLFGWCCGAAEILWNQFPYTYKCTLCYAQRKPCRNYFNHLNRKLNRRCGQLLCDHRYVCSNELFTLFLKPSINIDVVFASFFSLLLQESESSQIIMTIFSLGEHIYFSSIKCPTCMSIKNPSIVVGPGLEARCE